MNSTSQCFYMCFYLGMSDLVLESAKKGLARCSLNLLLIQDEKSRVKDERCTEVTEMKLISRLLIRQEYYWYDCSRGFKRQLISLDGRSTKIRVVQEYDTIQFRRDECHQVVRYKVSSKVGSGLSFRSLGSSEMERRSASVYHI